MTLGFLFSVQQSGVNCFKSLSFLRLSVRIFQLISENGLCFRAACDSTCYECCDSGSESCSSCRDGVALRTSTQTAHSSVCLRANIPDENTQFDLGTCTSKVIFCVLKQMQCSYRRKRILWQETSLLRGTMQVPKQNQETGNIGHKNLWHTCSTSEHFEDSLFSVQMIKKVQEKLEAVRNSILPTSLVSTFLWTDSCSCSVLQMQTKFAPTIACCVCVISCSHSA